MGATAIGKIGIDASDVFKTLEQAGQGAAKTAQQIVSSFSAAKPTFDTGAVINGFAGVEAKAVAVAEHIRTSFGGFVPVIHTEGIESAFHRIPPIALKAGEDAGAAIKAGTEKHSEGLFSKLREGFAESAKGAIAVFGGGLALGGTQALIGGFEAVLEKGIAVKKTQEDLELAFARSGIAEEDNAKALKVNAKNTEELSDKYATSKGNINEFTKSYLGLGGSYEKLKERQEQAIALTKLTGLSYEAAGKALAKSDNPEAQAQLTKIGIKFRANATEAERNAIIQEKLGGTLEKLKEQAQGPLGSIDRLENSFKSIQGVIGSALIDLFAPILEGVGKYVVPAVQSGIKELKGFLAQAREGVGGVLSFLAPLLEFIAGNILKQLQVAFTLVKVAFNIVLFAISSIADALKPIGDAFKSLFTGFDKGKEDSIDFGAALKGIGEVLTLIGKVIIEIVLIPLKGMASVVTALVAGIGNFIRFLFGAKQEISGVGQSTDKAKTAMQSFSDVITAIKAVIGGIVAVIHEYTGAIGTFIGSLTSGSLTNIKNALTGLITFGDRAKEIYNKGAAEVTETAKKEADEQVKIDAAKAALQGKTADELVTELEQTASTLSKKQIAEAKKAADARIKLEVTAKELSATAEGELQKRLEAIGKETHDKAAAEEAKFQNEMAALRAKGAKLAADAQKAADQEALNQLEARAEKVRSNTELTAQQQLSQIAEIERSKLVIQKRLADAALDDQKQAAQADIERQRKDIELTEKNAGRKASRLAELKKIEEQLNKDAAARQATADGVQAEKELASAKKLADERLKIDVDAAKKSVDAITKQLNSLADTDKVKKATIKVDLVQAQGNQALEEFLAQNREIKAANEELAKAMVTKNADVIAEAEKKLAEARANVLANNADALAIIRKNNKDIEAATKELNLTVDTDRISKIEDTAEREKETRLLKAREALDAELKLSNGNRDVELLAYDKFAAEKLKIDSDYGQRSNILYSAFQKVRDGIKSVFERKDDAKTREDLKKQKDDNQSSLDDVLKRQKEGVISYQEANKEIQALLQKRKEIEEAQSKLGSGNSAAEVLQKLARAAAQATSDFLIKNTRSEIDRELALRTAAADKRIQIAELEAKKKVAIEKGNAKDLERVQKQLDEAKTEATKLETDRGEQTKQVYADVALSAAASFGSLVASGVSAGKAMAVAALDALQSLVPVLVAQITGVQLASPANILPGAGLVAALALTSIFEGLVAAAKAAVGAIHGRHNYQGEGSFVIPGATTDPFLIRVHPGEDIFSPEVSAENRSLFKSLHEGTKAATYFEQNYLPSYIKSIVPVMQKIARAEMSGNSIGVDGRLTQALFSKLKEVAAAERTREQQRYSEIRQSAVYGYMNTAQLQPQPGINMELLQEVRALRLENAATNKRLDVITGHTGFIVSEKKIEAFDRRLEKSRGRKSLVRAVEPQPQQ